MKVTKNGREGDEGGKKGGRWKEESSSKEAEKGRKRSVHLSERSGRVEGEGDGGTRGGSNGKKRGEWGLREPPQEIRRRSPPSR